MRAWLSWEPSRPHCEGLRLTLILKTHSPHTLIPSNPNHTATHQPVHTTTPLAACAQVCAHTPPRIHCVCVRTGGRAGRLACGLAGGHACVRAGVCARLLAVSWRVPHLHALAVSWRVPHLHALAVSWRVPHLHAPAVSWRVPHLHALAVSWRVPHLHVLADGDALHPALGAGRHAVHTEAGQG